MAYRFELGEDLPSGIRRVVAEQIDRGLSETAVCADHAVAIHETRKSLKRIRALLKLVRPMLGDARYREENARFRDIAKALSGTRDAHVLHETLSLLELSRPQTAGSAILELRQALPSLSTDGGGQPAAAVSTTNKALQKAKRFYRNLEFKNPNPEQLFEGLRLSYKAARKAKDEAFQNGSDDGFHEWRKPVQVHWRQMRLLAEAWPEALAVRINAARELSHLLGRDHDLSVLAAFAASAAEHGKISSEAVAATIRKAVRSEQLSLRRQAQPIGARLFAEAASAHAARLAALWRAAGKTSGTKRRARQAGKAKPTTRKQKVAAREAKKPRQTTSAI